MHTSCFSAVPAKNCSTHIKEEETSKSGGLVVDTWLQGGKTPQKEKTPCCFWLAKCARRVCTKPCAGRVKSISTLHVGPDQPDLGRNPSPNPDPNPLGASRSAGAVARLRCMLWWRLSKKQAAEKLRKVSLDQTRRTTCIKFSADPSCTWGQACCYNVRTKNSPPTTPRPQDHSYRARAYYSSSR